MKKQFRAAGGDRKTKVPQTHVTLFEWFVDVQTSLSARLPRSLLLKAPELYEDWLKQHPNTPDTEKLCFQNLGWRSSRKGFGVSLYLPNKRLSASKPDCLISVVDYLKNIWSIHHFLNSLVLIPILLMATKCLFAKMRAANKQLQHSRIFKLS